MTAACAASQGWRIGGHVLRGDGTLWHGSTFISLTPLQRRLLTFFCSKPGELINRDQLAAEAWHQPRVSDQTLARGIHGLRRVLDGCGLGGECIATLYGSGYVFTAPVTAIGMSQAESTQAEAAPAMGQPELDTAARLALAREHHIEGRTLARSRNPARIPAALQHLRQSLELDPTCTGAATDLCWVLLLQVGWGLMASQATARDIRTLLEPLPTDATGETLGVQAEVVSLLEWRPAAAEPLYVQARSQPLRRRETTLSWARQLLATGLPGAALALLRPVLREDLPLGWRLTALAHWHQHDREAALACLNRQLAMDPSLVSSHLMAAMLQTERGSHREALQHLSAVRRQCDRTAGLLGLHPVVAYVLARTGARDRAGMLLERASQHADLGLPSLWGLAALALENDAAADRWFQEAVARRCYQAPFVRHSPLLKGCEGTGSVERFRAAMARAFG